jgi:hypothetical protein
MNTICVSNTSLTKQLLFILLLIDLSFNRSLNISSKLENFCDFNINVKQNKWQ